MEYIGVAQIDLDIEATHVFDSEPTDEQIYEFAENHLECAVVILSKNDVLDLLSQIQANINNKL